ncbi:exodeoxyribonuclease III [Alloalcanivorax gelatiniphagus]|uniref:Exodeoxyribonuclease III n=1 Tax=Alloalcanivorax gelatiniphagus TaxID=1194167 RepID=A0ABY2XNE1_9GAMM|nr:exodeoxyribonuclease III [Alloalcanivorax gelatiniphagus]TMW13289.1 exodeoxyribonuclease III [Alloalcanivorax gelatiniphagus]|tara:strand:+ start:4642 stop:5466 length:825 start_codon:yes stop_codon:yes gene_type:complete
MTLISFNINGIRARLHQLETLLEKYQPTLVGLQETKVQDSEFPEQAVRDLGYHPYYFGQKGHYGVALLTREPLEAVRYGFPGDGEDAQKRMIIGRFNDADGKPVTVLNGYFPQGENREHPVKFPAKEKFYQDLQDYLEQHHSPDEQLAIMGDFNISSTDRDIGIGEANRKRWLREGKTSFLPEEREWWQRLLGWGLTDTFRHRFPDTDDVFSWFDYRSKGFDRDPRRGLRIDTVLATPALLERLTDTGVDYDIRGMERPSDHCPVWSRFDNLPS